MNFPENWAWVRQHANEFNSLQQSQQYMFIVKLLIWPDNFRNTSEAIAKTNIVRTETICSSWQFAEATDDLVCMLWNNTVFRTQFYPLPAVNLDK